MLLLCVSQYNCVYLTTAEKKQKHQYIKPHSFTDFPYEKTEHGSQSMNVTHPIPTLELEESTPARYIYSPPTTDCSSQFKIAEVMNAGKTLTVGRARDIVAGFIR